MGLNGRTDITQQNFKNFMHDIRADFRSPYGFNSKGIIVLTDDYHLFETLRQQELTNKHRVRVLQDFGLGGGELNAATSLNEKWKNSIYFEQQAFTSLSTDRDMGGAHLLILADDAEKLKNYIQTIIDYHVKSCQISLDSKTWLNKFEFMACQAPALYFYITVNNKLSNVELRNELLPIKLNSHVAILSNKGELINGKKIIETELENLTSQLKSATFN